MSAPQPPLVGIATDQLTLADLLVALDGLPTLTLKRRRELKSSVMGVARLCGNTPASVPLDFAEIRAKLAATNPVAHNISPKRLANIKWGFAHAVRATGLLPVRLGRTRTHLDPTWASFLASLPDRRSRFGLSRLAHFASAAGRRPAEIDDDLLDELMHHLDTASLRANQGRLRRTTAIIWNEVVESHAELGLTMLTVPASRQKLTRVKMELLPPAFREDIEAYLAWCAGTDPFAVDARDRPLAASTVMTLRGYISAAVTNLVESGWDVQALTRLADLTSHDAVKRVLKTGCDRSGQREDAYTFNTGQALLRIAREWAKVDPEPLARLRRMVMKTRPRSLGTMTERNVTAVAQFNDPVVLERLKETPARLWRQAMAAERPNRWTLAGAQAALALAMLTYMPVRLQNLVTLTFDVHLNLLPGARARSTMVIPGEEVKNGEPIAFDIPPHIVTMLAAYRDVFVPKLIGRRPTQVFINVDGKRKTDKALRYLIQTYMRRHVGVDFNPHTFRHLASAVVLTRYPGGGTPSSKISSATGP
jgi:hypothetical protein